MDDATRRYLDDGYVGDWIRVTYLVGMETTCVEGEYGGFRRSGRGNWYLDVVGLILIPTIDVESIELLASAGCL